MTQKLVLVVEDEEDILELVAFNLAKGGYEVLRATTGEEGLKQARSCMPDLVLLDLMLPGLDGLEVCRELKRDSKTEPLPIIMLTARSEESDIIAGLELGADDYLTKPFSPKVLLARVRAVIRRRGKPVPDETSVVEIHGLTIDPSRHELLVDGEQVELTFSQLRILHLLARRPGWVFTRSKIVDAVRGANYPVTERSVDVHIVNLRRKLGPYGAQIETVRGVGYRFKE